MSRIVGSQLYAIDFHVHTTASYDYENENTQPEQIVSAAIQAGLSAIAITDHNTVTGIEAIQKAAADSPLVIFPVVGQACPKDCLTKKIFLTLGSCQDWVLTQL